MNKILTIFNNPILNKVFFSNIIPLNTDVVFGLNAVIPNLREHKLPALESLSILIYFSLTDFNVYKVLINHNYEPENFSYDQKFINDLKTFDDKLFSGFFNTRMFTQFYKNIIGEEILFTQDDLNLNGFLIENKYLFDVKPGNNIQSSNIFYNNNIHFLIPNDLVNMTHYKQINTLATDQINLEIDPEDRAKMLFMLKFVLFKKILT